MLPALTRPAWVLPVRQRNVNRRVRARRARPRVPALLLLPVVLLASGCGSLFGAFDVAPSGLRKPDDRVRELLAAGRFSTALEQVAPNQRADPGDELLRLLYEGTAAHYAGQYDVSNDAFERAAYLAEDRYTRSISRTVLSLVTSDRVVDYEPGRTERLMLPYFAALNRLRQLDLDGAAVEARRLSFLLQRHDDARDDAADRPLRAFLRYFAGTVFEAAGDRNDADVAYRNAAALAGGALPWDTAPAPDTLGEVVVILERGFVAHRVEESVNLLLLPEDVEIFAHGTGDERATLSVLLAARVAQQATRDLYFGAERPRTLFVRPPPDYVPPRPARLVASACEDEKATAATDSAAAVKQDPKRVPVPGTTAPAANATRAAARECESAKPRNENPFLLRVAWPALRLQRRLPATGGVIRPDAGPDAEPHAIALTADLSDAVLRDFRDQRTAMLARTIARAAAKAVISRKIEGELSEREETVGRIAGLLANLGGALLEQADTRSWHLIPGSIGLARVRLPPGEHDLRLLLGGTNQNVELGAIPVRAGRITFVSARAWR